MEQVGRHVWRGPRVRALVVATVVGCASGAVHAQAVETAPWVERRFGEFSVLCNAQRRCYATTMLRVPSSEHAVYLEIARSGDPASAPTITLGFSDTSGLRPQATMRRSARIEVVGGEPLSMTLTARGEDGAMRYTIAGDALAFARRLSDAQSVRLENADDTYVTIPLAGSAAAMRFIDDQQRRVGTTTALVARGTNAPSTLRPPPARREIRRADAVAQTNLPTRVPEAVRALRPCEPGSGDALESFAIARLAPRTLLVKLRCGSTRERLTASYYVVDARGHARPIERDPAAGLARTRYDAATRTLTSAPEGHCVFETTWVYTGRRFALLRHALETCGRSVVAYEATVVDDTPTQR